MKHSTSLKKWARALVLDTALIGGFGYALHFGHETAQSIFAFFFWWMVATSLFLYFIFTVVGFTKDVTAPDGTPKGEQVYNALWNEKFVNSFAVSNTFLVYHVLTDLLMITLLLLSGRWVLGSFKMFTFLGTLVMIQHARSLKEERNAPTPPNSGDRP